MKNENIGMTFTNWVISILGIIILLCVIILPPVFRVYFKEEVKEEEPDEIEVIENLNCTFNNKIVSSHMDNDTISFTYYKDQIRQYTRRIEKSYSSLDEYETDKLEFGKKATGYSLLEGVTYSVNTDDTELSIVISEKFDLGLFKETSITIPGDAEAITMKADYSLNDSISTVKSNLESTGYTCKNTSE